MVLFRTFCEVEEIAKKKLSLAGVDGGGGLEISGPFTFRILA